MIWNRVPHHLLWVRIKAIRPCHSFNMLKNQCTHSSCRCQSTKDFPGRTSSKSSALNQLYVASEVVTVFPSSLLTLGWIFIELIENCENAFEIFALPWTDSTYTHTRSFTHCMNDFLFPKWSKYKYPKRKHTHSHWVLLTEFSTSSTSSSIERRLYILLNV